MAEASSECPSLPNRVRKLLQGGRRRFRRWSLGPKAKDKIQTWTELEETGAAIEELMLLRGWQVVETVKSYYQRRAEITARTPDVPEAMRLRAAIEYAMLETFFRDLRERVYHGQKAREALANVQTPLPEKG